MTERLTELFVFYRDGVPHHYHSDRSVFEKWMTESAWMFPRDRCEVVRFVPDSLGERVNDKQTDSQ